MSQWRTASFFGACKTGRFGYLSKKLCIMKSVHLENVTQMVSRIFTPVDAFIIDTFLLLYVHFSFDAPFIELQFLD